MQKEKEVLVELENISKIFDRKVWAIKKINLKIYKGDGIGIIGPNQSGKTVLGRLIANQIRQTGGILEYNFNRGDVLSSVGFQFRDTIWPDGFKVKEIVNLYKSIYNMEDEAWLDELSSVFNIQDRWDNYLNSCNKSWLQLFSLFLAFIHKPELVILDEVSNTIGMDMKVKVLSFLKKYKEDHKATFVVISPDNSIFDYLCNRIIVMESGLILSDDYVNDWDSNTRFEDYTLKVMKTIESKEVKLKPDPVFKPILKKYEKKLEKATEIYDVFINSFDNIETVQNDKIFNKIKNINFNSQELHQKIITLASTGLNKSTIDDVKIAIKKLIKLFKDLKKQYKKVGTTHNYWRLIKRYLQKVEFFPKYLSNDLYGVFKTNKIIVDGNEITAELSKKELTQLRLLKKKYIQEEIKIMKFEAKILKRQERSKKQLRNLEQKNTSV